MNSLNSQIIELNKFVQSSPADYDFYCGTTVDEERRWAPRHKVSLQSSVLVTAVETVTPGVETYFVLQGQLLDVSVSGLALIISKEDLIELKKLDTNIRLLLMLPLPIQAIELEAIPVRFQQHGQAGDNLVLLGAQITNMSGRDRILFMDFINRCDSINLKIGRKI